MAVPRSKTSKAVTKRRQTINMKLVSPQLVSCPNCGTLVKSHQVCPVCGHYRGKQYVTPSAKTNL